MSQITNLWRNYDSANSCLAQMREFISLLEQKDLREKDRFAYDEETYKRQIENDAFHRLSQIEGCAAAVGAAKADLEDLYNRF